MIRGTPAARAVRIAATTPFSGHIRPRKRAYSSLGTVTG
jgi:hypothetical protein